MTGRWWGDPDWLVASGDAPFTSPAEDLVFKIPEPPPKPTSIVDNTAEIAQRLSAMKVEEDTLRVISENRKSMEHHRPEKPAPTRSIADEWASYPPYRGV